MKNRNFEKRLRALEERFRGPRIVVILPDGSRQELSRPQDYETELLRAAINRSHMTPALLADLKLMSSAIGMEGDAGLVNLAWAIYNSPE